MRKIMFLLGLLAWAPVLAAMPVLAQPSNVQVTEPFARAAPAGRTAAAYMKLQGGPDKLVGAESDAAERVELHETAMENGVMTMRPVAGVLINPGAATRLMPGGLHFMLVQLKQSLKEGDMIRLTLVFERAGKISVHVPVARAGSLAPPGGHRRH